MFMEQYNYDSNVLLAIVFLQFFFFMYPKILKWIGNALSYNYEIMHIFFGF